MEPAPQSTQTSLSATPLTTLAHSALSPLKDLLCFSFVQKHLSLGEQVMFMCVVEASDGSPGRQGFKMAIAESGEMVGTIGGGIMEFKVIQEAQRLMAEASSVPHVHLQPQNHNRAAPQDRSGMICSGYQMNVSLLCRPEQQELFAEMSQSYAPGGKQRLEISPSGICVRGEVDIQAARIFQRQDDANWSYSERLAPPHVMHIVGGGHVGLALSRAMRALDFYVKVYDERSQLHLLDQNIWAHEIVVTPFSELGKLIPEGDDQFVAVVSTGFKTDEAALRELLGRKYAYLGVMGSTTKISHIVDALAQAGMSQDAFSTLRAPIGLPIRSHSVEEIAVSIAAEIIQIKNKS